MPVESCYDFMKRQYDFLKEIVNDEFLAEVKEDCRACPMIMSHSPLDQTMSDLPKIARMCKGYVLGSDCSMWGFEPCGKQLAPESSICEKSMATAIMILTLFLM